VEVEADGMRVAATATIRTGVPRGAVFISGASLSEGPAQLRPASAKAAVA
jgi:hypothetical protein